ncbi:MAG: DUF1566 domain-containing protein [Deltaproteobacteria bacterium]|nr:DUF1566 domain-containing protein [Deltaproteobacteria bacterium]
MKNKAAIILIFLTMIIGYGCEETLKEEIVTEATEETTEETAAESNLASINVSINMNAQSNQANFNALGTVDEIATITVDAWDASDDTAISSTTLDNIDGIWTGTLGQLPYDLSLNFNAKGLNADDEVIYSGTLTQTLVEGADNDVSIALSSIDDGVQPDNPVIVSVSIPQKVLIDSDPQLISFNINYTADVSYTINVTSGKIAAAFDDVPVSSLSGVHNPASNLDLFFTAPSSPGAVELTITIKDLISSDTVGASYFLDVVSFDPDTWTDSGVIVIFGPAITDLAFSRSATALKLTLSTNPESGLVYDWQGTGDFASLNTSGNPIFITDFNDAQTGEIRVTVTDENNLTAFMTRTILAGDYPYTVNEYILDMPGIYIFDDTTQLLWQDNTNKISRKWADANTYCQSLNLVNYLVWRLPTKNELVNMYARKGDFSNFYPEKYWTADEDPVHNNKRFTVSFKDGTVKSEDKNKKKLVRCVKD